MVGLEDEVKGLVNVHVQVAQTDGELKFLHTVADGPCDDSYGVQVAALAGLPREVVERASDLLNFLESQARGAKAGESGAPASRDSGQASLMGYFAAAAMGHSASQTVEVQQISLEPGQQAVLDYLSTINADDMSPRQAQDALYRLKKMLGGE